LRVLCIDDEPRVLVGLRRQLAVQYEVETAASGPEGLEILEQLDDVAVIITDLRMPDMDGLAFLREALNLSPDSVGLVLTGYGDVVELSAALNAQLIFRILNKPCPRAKLLAVVADAVEVYRQRLSEA
jgi:DNA-binding NtrC family response regulator